MIPKALSDAFSVVGRESGRMGVCRLLLRSDRKESTARLDSGGGLVI